MKKILALILAGTALLGLMGCSAQAAAPKTTQETAETEAPAQTEETVPNPTAAEEEPAEKIPLYLTVSSITFSVVGESEDIYLGLAPRDQITWESEDPDIVSVEDGVLTARGVGTTTVRALCGELQAECRAGCLAQTQEELENLDPEILSRPKRTVPETELESPCTFYDHSVLVGDSIALMMMQHESKDNSLGELLVLARNGTSMMGLVQRFKNIYYQGGPMNLEDIIARSGTERMYILLGANDIACEPNRLAYFDNWETMLGRIREKSPDVEIVAISNMPRCPMVINGEKLETVKYNGMVREDNAALERFCRDHGCGYLNLAQYIEDHQGRMALEYNFDGTHMNDLGYAQWIRLMHYYARFELDGGKII